MSSEICSDFRTVECQEFCARIADGTHDSPKEAAEGKRLVTSKNVKGGRLEIESAYLISQQDFDAINKRSKVDQWDLLLTMIGTVGEVCVVSQPNPDFAIKNVGLLKCGDELKAKWLYYFLRSPQGQELIDQRKKGSTQQYISLTEIRKLPVSLPETADAMRDIVDILTSLDNRITLLREINATLEAIAQALFKSWFVDFDPVRAKMEGRAPEGLDEATAALFPYDMEQSELGLVPRGWRVGSLGDVTQTHKKLLQPAELHAGLHYVGLEHIPRKSLSLDDWGTADGLESAKAAFADGDILFGKLRPYFHKVVVAPFDGVCSTDILVCQAQKPVYYGFVAMQLFSKALIDYAERLSNGAKMPRVGWKDISAYPIIVPAEAVAVGYTGIVKPLLARMKANVHAAQTLAALRDTLLPRLISGQLRLSETPISA